jgi:hypothetical protein
VQGRPCAEALGSENETLCCPPRANASFYESSSSAHKTAQVPIAAIESMTGLSFGSLAAVDPLGGGGGEEARPRALTDFTQIRFV